MYGTIYATINKLAFVMYVIVNAQLLPFITYFKMHRTQIINQIREIQKACIIQCTNTTVNKTTICNTSICKQTHTSINNTGISNFEIK